MAASAPVQTDPEGKVEENSIPKSRVDAMIAKATAEASAKAAAAEARAELETERRKDLETRSQPAAAPASPAPETRVLFEMRVEQRVASKQEIKDRGAKIGAQIDQYLERVPDLDDPTSDNHKRVRAEFAALRKLDFPNDATTELMALRAVLGDLSKVKIPETGNVDREVDMTTHAGAGDEGEPEKSKGPGPLKGLKAAFVDHYTKGIEAGRFSGWDDEKLQRIMKRELSKG
jgi:hypothetical protein